MTNLSYTLPTIGNANSTEDPLIRTGLSDVKSAYNLDHATGGHTLSWLAAGSSAQIIVCDGAGVPTYRTLSGATISNTGVLSAIPDSSLSSPTSGTYRDVYAWDQVVFGPDFLGPATGYFTGGGTVTTSPHNISFSPGTLQSFMGTVLDSAQYVVAGQTPTLRLIASIRTNATAPGINFTFGLYPVTFSGAADVLTETAGAVVAGSTAVINAPGASAVTTTTGAAFTFPSTGFYTAGLSYSGGQANNSAAMLGCRLQVHHS